jgi:hypothetical protein
MSFRTLAPLAFTLAMGAPLSSHADVSDYSQNFELLAPAAQGQGNNSALSADGWLAYANIFAADGTYITGYFVGGAPNGSSAFSGVTVGAGGPQQGQKQLVVYSDYNNAGSHGSGQLLESLVYQQRTIGAADVGATWLFQFDAALYNLVAPSTAQAFVKTLDPDNFYQVTGYSAIDMSAVTGNWGTYSISFANTASAGQVLQFGFSNVATHYAGSGVTYDNLSFSVSSVPEPTTGGLMIAGLALFGLAARRRAR